MRISRTAVLLLATGTLFIAGAAMSSYGLFLPVLQEEFQWSRAMAVIPFTVAMAAWGAFSPVSGKLLDEYGTRPVILAGLVCMALGFLLMGTARGLGQLVVGYGLLVGLGIGAAGNTVISILISKHFPPEKRAGAVGFSQIATPANPLVAALAISASLLAFPLAWLGAHDPREDGGTGASRLGLWDNLGYFRDPDLLRLMVARFACGLGFFFIAHMLPLALSNGLGPEVGAKAVSVYGGSAVLGALLVGGDGAGVELRPAPGGRGAGPAVGGNGVRPYRKLPLVHGVAGGDHPGRRGLDRDLETRGDPAGAGPLSPFLPGQGLKNRGRHASPHVSIILITIYEGHMVSGCHRWNKLWLV